MSPVIQCVVEGRTISALVDLGSEATLVRKSCVKGMGHIAIRQCKKFFRGVTGKAIDVIGEVLVKINVTPKIQTNHVMIVVPDHLMETDCLFGADLLGKYDMLWSAKRKTLVWGGYSYNTGRWPVPKVLRLAGSIRRISAVKPTNTELDVIKDGSKNIHISKKLTIRKRTVQVVKFKISTEEKNVLIKLKQSDKELSMITEVNDGCVYLPIFNVKNGTLRLKAGHLIATYEPVSGIEYLNLDGEVLGTEEVLVDKLLDGLKGSEDEPTLCHVCDSHYEILASRIASIPESCHLVNVGESWEACAMRDGITDKIITVRNLVEIENTMLPDNLRGKGDNSDISRIDTLKSLLRKQDLTHLNKDQKRALRKVVLSHDNLFVLSPKELGCIKIPPVQIHMENDKPVRSPSYRHPEKAKEIILNLAADMKDKDVIEASSAAWLSPIVLVSKPNSSSKRFCVDF